MSQIWEQTANQQVIIQNSVLAYQLVQIQPLSAAIEPQHGFSRLMHLNFDNKALHTKNLLLQFGTKENKWQVTKLPLQSYHHQ